MLHVICCVKIKLFLPIILLIIDRLIKYFAPSIDIGGGFLKIDLYKNYAGAFSLPIAGILYDIAGIILLIIFLIIFFKEIKKAYSLQLIAYSLIVFGGASNLFDRLYFGYVIDYVQVLQRSFFNIADTMIIFGIVILLNCYIIERKKTDNITI